MKKRKICVVTGTRADYGLLQELIREIEEKNNLELQLLVTGSHLSPEYGLTFRKIKNDGFKISKKIEILLSADTPSSLSKSTALGLIGFADALKELNPDILIVLGDRYEILSAAVAATFEKIPIAHIHGGETTLGAFDESIRHSITKMSWWHFVATEEYKKRVIQLGENPNRVYNVGGMGVDTIKKMKLLNKKNLMKETKIRFRERNILVTYHPTTLDSKKSYDSMREILYAMDELNDAYIIFTMPNADSESRIIKEMINEFVKNNNNRSISFNSMGQLNYLSTLQLVDCVVGNSSSGIMEAPTFNIGTINIGDRQKGRVKPGTVIDCDISKDSILKAIKKLYSKNFQKKLHLYSNPYGEGGSSNIIADVLSREKLPKELKKIFYDL